jgi:hypothetical protein
MSVGVRQFSSALLHAMGQEERHFKLIPNLPWSDALQNPKPALQTAQHFMRILLTFRKLPIRRYYSTGGKPPISVCPTDRRY